MRLPLAILLLAAAAVQAAPAPASCAGLHRHGKLAEAQACYMSLLDSADPYIRAEALWGLERYNDSNDQFRLAVKQHPDNAAYRVRWGRLFLDRYTNAEAVKLFREALEIDKNDADAYLGLALAESDGFSKKPSRMPKKPFSSTRS